MLELESIAKVFGGVTALNNVSMHIATGEVRGLIGPNGAGKTTLINLISGLLTQSAGSLFLDGDRLDQVTANKRAELGIARTFQNLRVFKNLSVAQSAIKQFELDRKLGESAESLAYGHLRKLEIVRALALGPKVLLLDEPAAGMNEAETEELARSLRWVHSSADCAMVVIDHDLKFIMALCDNISVMNMGELIAEGTPEEISRNQDVIDAYLGSER